MIWEKIPDRLVRTALDNLGDPQSLSSSAEADSESVHELADTDQALEAGIVEGVEDAADHPERPVHTHLDYGRPDDVPPRAGLEKRGGARTKEPDVEDLPDERAS